MTVALEELAVRVEALDGPDREVDALIWCALRGVKYKGHGPSYFQPHLTQVEFTSPPRRTRQVSNGKHLPHAEAYTASIDAAMTLVPEGWGWLVSQPNAKALASGLLKERTPVLGEVQYGCDHRYAVAAATPALALCCAALRARSASTVIGGDL